MSRGSRSSRRASSPSGSRSLPRSGGRRHCCAGTSRGSRRRSRRWRRSSPETGTPTRSGPSPPSGTAVGTRPRGRTGTRRTRTRTTRPRPATPSAPSPRTPPGRRSPAWRPRVLVLAGEVDLNSPPPAMAGIAALFPHAELVVQPGAGHFPWLDDPERFVSTTTAFLARPAHRGLPADDTPPTG
ncbi:alpha/beta fold hydrolase [Streptomyces sp. NPDC091209]|uniref:alpha/beta fold hydrolase n=1 Tax=Streptomyces sp. NPDC091209 TaxID=3365974 RepID=UPI00381EA2D5